MLRNTKDLEHYAIHATDGKIGEVKDFYFDDKHWAIRYLVVDTSAWLPNRKVLISPVSILHPKWQDRALTVSLSKEQVKNSPNIDTDKPVSHQHEEQYLGYYGYPTYWGGLGMWGNDLYPYAMSPDFLGYGEDQMTRELQLESWLRAERAAHRNDDPHLRSCNAVSGYHIRATDGDIGHVTGYLVDDETWAIRYLVVDTSNWWIGHQVLIAPAWLEAVQWATRTVSVDMTREAVRTAPVYDPTAAWSRELHLDLYRHHKRADYWAEGTQPALV